MNTRHRCLAPHCEYEIPLRLLMCKRHWNMVPRELQKEVWRTYRPGQEKDLGLVGDDYVAAVRSAQAAVAAKESQR